MFRIFGDTIYYDGLPVAAILPTAWPTRRDYIERTLDGFDPCAPDEIDYLKDQIAELESQVRELIK